jgi:hypothetical protein
MKDLPLQDASLEDSRTAQVVVFIGLTTQV